MFPEINEIKQDLKEIKQDLRGMIREVRRNFGILRIMIALYLVLELLLLGLLFKIDSQIDDLTPQIKEISRLLNR